MPKKQEKPYQRVLQYFETAPIQEASIILDMATAKLKDRQATAANVAAAIPPRGPRRVTPPAAQTTAAADKPAGKKKPGPKPGSRNKSQTQAAPGMNQGGTYSEPQEMGPQ